MPSIHPSFHHPSILHSLPGAAHSSHRHPSIPPTVPYYNSLHTFGFEQSLIIPQGFEHPSEVQQVCLPQAILSTDILCQAKSGLGKTAVFVLATLQQIEPVDGEVSVLVLCHTRELAFQIRNEYARFGKYMPNVRTAVFYGGTPIQKDIELIKNKDTCPHIVVATPGRLNGLVRDKYLRVGSVKNFVLDECDKMLEAVGMIPRSRVLRTF